jgi:hypothetical protein
VYIKPDPIVRIAVPVYMNSAYDRISEMTAQPPIDATARIVKYGMDRTPEDCGLAALITRK